MIKMLLALNQENIRIKAQPNIIGICPECKEELIPKCGSIKIWHWSHKQKSDCYYSSHPMTSWHYGWQEFAFNHGFDIEVTKIDEYEANKKHRADIIDEKNKRVIELQYSNISQKDILDRCEFFKSIGYTVDWFLNLNKKYELNHLTFFDTKNHNDEKYIQIKYRQKIFDCLYNYKNQLPYTEEFTKSAKFSNPIFGKIVIDLSSGKDINPLSHTLFNVKNVIFDHESIYNDFGCAWKNTYFMNVIKVNNIFGEKINKEE